MPADEINVNATVLNGEISVKPEEHPADRALRLKTEHRQTVISDFQNVAIFVTLLLGIILVGGLAGYEGVVDPAASSDTKRWGQTVLSAILTGGISFVVGRMSRAR
jgi:hypothetical protein